MDTPQCWFEEGGDKDLGWRGPLCCCDSPHLVTSPQGRILALQDLLLQPTPQAVRSKTGLGRGEGSAGLVAKQASDAKI